jgi:DNA (cytosine-5)-methyltransferase 1
LAARHILNTNGFSENFVLNFQKKALFLELVQSGLIMKKKVNPIEAVDIFCGAGGLTCGLLTAGLSVVAGIDIDAACRYPFEANHKGAKFLEKDVAKFSGNDLNKLWSKDAIRVLAGCAPCQPFSSYARGRSNDHLKWGMLSEFSRLVSETLPELVTMENVPGLARQQPFIDFLKNLEKNGYEVVYSVLNAADFGVPQSRKRLVLLASRIGKIALPTPTHKGVEKWRSVKDVVGKLPLLNDGEEDFNDPLHRSSSLSDLNRKRIRASKPGGTWRDWPQSLVAECHKKESGKHSGGVYGRMRWDRPAPTMTTLCNGYGNGRFGHPEQHRAISLREAAIFQSFPEKYSFSKPNEVLHVRTVARLIGNAVPPKLAEAVGRQLLAAALDKH